MIHENSLLGQYQAGVISGAEFFANKLFRDFCVTCGIGVIALIIGIVLISFRHKRTGISSILCAISFPLGSAAGLIMNTELSGTIWEDPNTVGVGALYLAYLILVWMIIRIIYSEMRFYVRIPVLYVIAMIMLFVTAIAHDFSFATLLSSMRVGYMVFSIILIALPLLPESDGGGFEIEDLIKDMTGDEY